MLYLEKDHKIKQQLCIEGRLFVSVANLYNSIKVNMQKQTKEIQHYVLQPDLTIVVKIKIQTKLKT